jgi:nucleotide-binding universal stress UspA family protein
MFNKMLVCLDGSTLAEQIMPYAIEQALHFHSEVILFQAVTVPTTTIAAAPGTMAPPATAAPTPEELEKLESEARVYLEGWAARLREKSISVDCVTQIGADAPAVTIINYAKEKAASLIVMATHGRSGLSRAVMGSVADKVIRESNLPTLVMRPSEEES